MTVAGTMEGVDEADTLGGAHYLGKDTLESARSAFVHFYAEYGIDRPEPLKSRLEGIMSALKCA